MFGVELGVKVGVRVWVIDGVGVGCGVFEGVVVGVGCGVVVGVGVRVGVWLIGGVGVTLGLGVGIGSKVVSGNLGSGGALFWLKELGKTFWPVVIWPGTTNLDPLAILPETFLNSNPIVIILLYPQITNHIFGSHL